MSIHPLNPELSAAQGTEDLPSLQPPPVLGRAGPVVAEGTTHSPQPNCAIKAPKRTKSFMVHEKNENSQKATTENQGERKINYEICSLDVDSLKNIYCPLTHLACSPNKYNIFERKSLFTTAASLMPFLCLTSSVSVSLIPTLTNRAILMENSLVVFFFFFPHFPSQLRA